MAHITDMSRDNSGTVDGERIDSYSWSPWVFTDTSITEGEELVRSLDLAGVIKEATQLAAVCSKIADLAQRRLAKRNAEQAKES